MDDHSRVLGLFNLISLLKTFSLTKWYYALMRFVLALKIVGFLVILTLLWWSHIRGVGCVMKNPTSCLNLCNHVISLVPSFIRFQYFTSIDESLTICGLFQALSHWWSPKNESISICQSSCFSISYLVEVNEAFESILLILPIGYCKSY